VKSDQRDLQETLRPVLVLIKRLDKISLKNNDVFAKAYFKMLVVVLPSMMALFQVHVSNGQRINNSEVIEAANDDFL
jgi:hypothetical protein